MITIIKITMGSKAYNPGLNAMITIQSFLHTNKIFHGHTKYYILKYAAFNMKGR